MYFKLILLALPLCFFASKTTYHYEKSVNNETTPMTWTIEKKDDKLLLQVSENIGPTTLTFSENFKKLNDYKFISSSNKPSYMLTKKGDKININYLKNKGSLQNGTLKSNLPWIQQFGFGLRPFMSSSHAKIKFTVVNSDKTDLVKIVALKEEKLNLKIKDKNYKAQHIKVTLPGFKGMFWQADLYFDIASHDMLKYEGNSGPGTPTETQLFISKDEDSLFNLIDKNKENEE